MLKNALRICKTMNEFHALMLTPWFMHECKIMYENKMLLCNNSTSSFIQWLDTNLVRKRVVRWSLDGMWNWLLYELWFQI